MAGVTLCAQPKACSPGSADSGTLLHAILVQATIDDHTLAVTKEIAKEAFAIAVEWQTAGRFNDVSISEGARSYSIAEFSSVMSLLEMANTVEAAALKVEGK